MRIESVYYNADGGLNVGARPYNTKTKSFEAMPLKKCKEEPEDSFEAALQKLDSLGVRMCELPSTMVNEIKVKGLTVKYNKNGESLKLKLSRRMEEGDPHVFDTPTRVSKSEKDGEDFLTIEEMQLVENVVDEAQAYYNGRRKALDRPLEEKKQETRTAYAQGVKAQEDGGSTFDNPYNVEQHGEDAMDSWNKGFMDSQRGEAQDLSGDSEAEVEEASEEEEVTEIEAEVEEEVA